MGFSADCHLFQFSGKMWVFQGKVPTTMVGHRAFKIRSVPGGCGTKGCLNEPIVDRKLKSNFGGASPVLLHLA